MCVHDSYWYTMVLWLIIVDQSEPVVEPYHSGMFPTSGRNGHVAHSDRQIHGHTVRMSKQSDWKCPCVLVQVSV